MESYREIRDDLQEIKNYLKGLNKGWMSLDECANYICISKNSLYTKTSKQEVPNYRIGKRIIFNTAEIDAWILNNCKVKSNAEIEMKVSTTILSQKKDGRL